MEAFIRGLLDDLPSWARAIASPITTRLLGVFRWIDTLLRVIRGPWRAIATAGAVLRIGIRDLGYWTRNTLWWVINTRIPAMVANGQLAVQRWVVPVIRAAIALALAPLLAFRTWTLGQLASLVNGVRDLRNWTLGQLASLVARLSKLDARVFGTWLTPARLAAWLVGAMWSALWRFGWTQVDKIADYFWRRRQALLLRGVAEIERQIGRLL